MKRERLLTLIDIVFAIITFVVIALCLIGIKDYESLNLGGVSSTKKIFFIYLALVFTTVSLWIQARTLISRVEYANNQIIGASSVLMFSCAVLPYVISVMLQSSLLNTTFLIVYLLITTLIFTSLLVIQKSTDATNKHIWLRKRSGIAKPEYHLTLIKVICSVVGILIWPPLILIAPFITFEYGFIATMIQQKKFVKAAKTKEETENIFDLK